MNLNKTCNWWYEQDSVENSQVKQMTRVKGNYTCTYVNFMNKVNVGILNRFNKGLEVRGSYEF